MISAAKESSNRLQDKEQSFDISGRELADLLFPVTPETFFAEYWGRKPLLIKGSPEKLERLIPGGFSIKDLLDAVSKTAAEKSKDLLLWSQTLYPTGDGLPLDITYIRPDEAEAAVAAGSNIATEEIDDRRLAKAAAAIKAQLNYPCDVKFNATLSPEGNGWPLHIDRASVFNFQCEGRKRFLVSPKPVVEAPCGSVTFTDDGVVDSFLYENEPWEEIERVDVSNLIEMILEPGDILYWPGGTLHGTKALSAATFNLAITVEPENFLQLVSRALETILKPNPAWRHLPMANTAKAKPGELPAETADFFAARFDELKEAVERLARDSSELNRQWQKSAADPGKTILSALRLDSAPPDGNPVGRKDRLRVSRKAPVTFAMGTDGDGEARIEVFFSGKEFGTSGEWMPFLKTMLEKGEFSAESALRWAGEGRRYPWREVRENLEALLAQGFLERV